MCLILGLMISMAWVTQENRQSRRGFLSADQQTRITEGEVDLEAFQELTASVAKLREEKTKYEQALASQSGDSKVLNESLQEAKAFAALTEVEGPGILITLSDSAKAGGTVSDAAVAGDVIIHDTDVLRVVNELFASGAEAIAVNGHRVSPRTAFRCVGTTILVNDVKIASPVRIFSVGDADTLYGAMMMPGGILAEIRDSDPAMVQIEKLKVVRVPAYSGTTNLKFGKVPAIAK
jgi:uncharacterized protein YlxW (UPF0749 family)